MKKKIGLYLFLFLILFIVTGCQKKEINNNKEIPKIVLEDEDDTEEYKIDDDYEVDETDLYGGKYGTADTIMGRTLVVSIYTDDATTSWNPLNKIDQYNMDDSLNNLKIATDWLEEQVSKYNKNAKFIYDWRKYPDLKYNAKFSDISFKEDNYGDYYKQNLWIINNIDILSLKKKYQYDNIIFMFLVNMQALEDMYPRSNAYNSNWNLDIINLFVQNNYYYTTSAVYAHEILHLFGVPDLYRVNSKINQKYVDYVKENTHDIMNWTSETLEVTSTFSELDAYYAGLTNECDDVKKWGLGISDHY
jgi:hypothetical protein